MTDIPIRRVDDVSSPGADRAHPIVVALKEFSDGTVNLVKHHLALARYEATADVIAIGKDAASVVIALGFVILGYLFLLLSGIVIAGWFAGILGMGIAALSIALIHLIGGALLLRAGIVHFTRRRHGLVYTKNELKRNKKWAKKTLKSLTDSEHNDPKQLQPSP